jgi:6-pyruvoyltetrahydropterin/6-carboxytetrahydropterin synthase
MRAGGACALEPGQSAEYNAAAVRGPGARIMSRYQITVEAAFAAAHNLRSYKGSCEALHGHNYRVAVTLACDTLDHDGLVYDFKDLRRIAREVAARFDHGYINEVRPFDEWNPSAENLSRYFYDEIARRVADDRVRVRAVTVWETDVYSATYAPA